MLRSTGERGSVWRETLVSCVSACGGRAGDRIQEKYVSNVTISNMWPRQVAQTDHVNECRGGWLAGAVALLRHSGHDDRGYIVRYMSRYWWGTT